MDLGSASPIERGRDLYPTARKCWLSTVGKQIPHAFCTGHDTFAFNSPLCAVKVYTLLWLSQTWKGGIPSGQFCPGVFPPCCYCIALAVKLSDNPATELFVLYIHTSAPLGNLNIWLRFCFECLTELNWGSATNAEMSCPGEKDLEFHLNHTSLLKPPGFLRESGWTDIVGKSSPEMSGEMWSCVAAWRPTGQCYMKETATNSLQIWLAMGPRRGDRAMKQLELLD